MSDEIFLEGKIYVSSKKAASMSGYAQDYIGQLARTGAIDAQRVGGLWYVSMDSLAGYQRNAAAYTPAQPIKTAPDIDSVVSFDGKEYISASRASKVTGYNQDYIGQLARSGKILSRQIGNRWYIEREGLTAHKREKDRLLAAVQTESVGLARPSEAALRAPERASAPLMNYFTESKDLMPILSGGERPKDVVESGPVAIPIRIVEHPHRTAVAPVMSSGKRGGRTHGKTIFRAAEIGVALTFVLVLSYGLVSIKSSSIYTVNLKQGSSQAMSNAFVASAAEAFEKLSAYIESLMVPEIEYHRR